MHEPQANARRAQAGTPPVPPRRRRAAAQVREAILAAAVEQFEQQGYSGATTAAIARRAQVTEAQIFRCFDNKAALFRASVFEPLNRHFAEFHARQLAFSESAASPRERAESHISELQEFIARHSRMLMTLVVAQAYDKERGADERGAQGPGLAEMMAVLGTYFERSAALMRARMRSEPAVAPELMVRISFAAVLGCALFQPWLIPPEIADDAAVRAATKAFVIDGISARQDFRES
jgi:AcrR family transcriptional regulator